ncbi:MAG: hypothetical protein WC082_03985 [Victivallales bacterium]
MLQVGISKQIITPERGVSLAGYFNRRPNTGVLDDLQVKAVLFKKDSVICGIVSFELVKTTLKLVGNIRNKLKAKGYGFADNLIMAATHTHTGPDLRPERGGLNDKQFACLEDRTVCAIEEAYANLQDSTLELAKINNNPCAFNRRYWMKDGTVATNPGKLNPNIDRPEGPVDDEILVLAIKQFGRLTGIICNICNHNDTVGGALVSAEWPGRMERVVQQGIGYDVPVLTLIGCSGNINHFDVSSDSNQTCYAEACRIGKVYGEIVMGLLDVLEPAEIDKIQVASSDFVVPYQVISEERASEAQAAIERLGNVSSDEDLTSEGIAAGDGAVAKMFAEQILDFKQKCSGKSRTFKLMNFKMGKDLMFLSAPGEPFTEAGLHIKEKSPFKYNFVNSYGNGSCGYMCMPECYKRGGYEILPVIGGGPREDSLIRLMAAWDELVGK